MTECFEVENYETVTGHREHNHCGSAVYRDGRYWCTQNGMLAGYVGSCANRVRIDDGQISMFGGLGHETTDR